VGACPLLFSMNLHSLYKVKEESLPSLLPLLSSCTPHTTVHAGCLHRRLAAVPRGLCRAVPALPLRGTGPGSAGLPGWLQHAGKQPRVRPPSPPLLPQLLGQGDCVRVLQGHCSAHPLVPAWFPHAAPGRPGPDQFVFFSVSCVLSLQTQSLCLLLSPQDLGAMHAMQVLPPRAVGQRSFPAAAHRGGAAPSAGAAAGRERVHIRAQ